MKQRSGRCQARLVWAGRGDEAKQFLLSAVNSGLPGALSELVALLRRAGRNGDAERILREAHTRDPAAPTLLAGILRHTGRSGEAESILRHAGTRGDTGALINLAELLQDSGRSALALIKPGTGILIGHLSIEPTGPTTGLYRQPGCTTTAGASCMRLRPPHGEAL